MKNLRHSAKTVAIGMVVVAGLAGRDAMADERRFVFNYETTTLPAGVWEYEQWVTWKHFSAKERFDFRHEIETGITDRFQVGLYVADWRYEDVEGEGSSTDYQGTAVEAIYQLTDPNKSVLGSALYGEVLVGTRRSKWRRSCFCRRTSARWRWCTTWSARRNGRATASTT